MSENERRTDRQTDRDRQRDRDRQTEAVGEREENIILISNYPIAL